MTIYNTIYLNSNSSSSSSSSNFFTTYPDKGITYESNDGVSPYVSPFDSHVNRDPKHPHRPAFGMSMNESIFNCNKGHNDRGGYDRNNHHEGGHHGNNHCGRVDYREHMPIPLVPTKNNHHGCA